jgi:uncharacterized membrane protein
MDTGDWRNAVLPQAAIGTRDAGRAQIVSETAQPVPRLGSMTNDLENRSSEPMHEHPSRWRRIGVMPKLPPPISPALGKHAEERARSTQNRIADAITRFAGSMTFVYIHVIWFATWIGFGVETYPFGLLTMIVSLEAIFLSTFVMISQNRADAKRQVIADEQWTTVKEEDHQNRDLLDISKQILELTKAVHASTSAAATSPSANISVANGKKATAESRAEGSRAPDG